MPLIGLALNYTQYGIRLVPILVVLSAFTILLALAAGVRRVWMPEAERFVVEGWGVREMVAVAAGAGAAAGAKAGVVGWRGGVV